MTAPPVPPRPLPRGPFVLLGLMTTMTILGPFLIGWVLSGGSSSKWPPDRPVEWATLLGVSATVLVLMLSCLALGFTTRQAVTQATRDRGATTATPTGDVPPRVVS